MSFETLRETLHKKLLIYRLLSNLYYLYVYPMRSKIQYVINYRRKTVIFFPHKPHPMEVLYKIFHRLGYSISNDPKAKSKLIISYEDTTFRTHKDIKNFFPGDTTIVNRFCNDISKKNVDSIFNNVFGYGITINPENYGASYVKKSNINAQHSGVILHKSEIAHGDFVYQKVINNQINDMVVDFRAPVIMGEIPFVYKKYRPVHTRFSNTNRYVEIMNTLSVFSYKEIEKILLFSKHIGLDYGELDILRNTDDKKIYIIDANNTPSGPPNHLSRADDNRALAKISKVIVKRILKHTP